MKTGIVYPQNELPATAETLHRFARGIEALGFDHIITYEHVLGANPNRPGGWTGTYSSKDPFWDPFVMYSYLSAVAPALSFTTAVLVLPQRQTALVAKQAACLDILCNGKFRLGVGLGWNQPEYVGMGENFHNRGSRLEEQITILRRLWQEPLVTFDGKWHHLEDVGLNPLPVQRPIPIWIGANQEKAIRRLARIADGWFPGMKKVEDGERELGWIMDEMQKSGRDKSSLGIEPRIPFGEGSPAVWKQTIDGWRGIGAKYCSLNTLGLGFKSVDEHLRAAEKFARVVITPTFMS